MTMPRALIIANRHDPTAQRHRENLATELGRHGWEAVNEDADDAGEFRIAFVLGGDGTFLRAANVARGRDIPLLGMNLGHMGFLAESDCQNIAAVTEQVVQGNFTIEQRAAVRASVYEPHEPTQAMREHTFSGWALNEAALQKLQPEYSLEVVIEVDHRPLSTFGCDGIVVSTPTGSTGHAFSAGGPVVWPDVDALLMVPVSAHALFSRPLVVSPTSVFAIEVLERSRSAGRLTLDGRRIYDVVPGSRVEVGRDPEAVKLVRLGREPFADRLVTKFTLPVQGWRGGDA